MYGYCALRNPGICSKAELTDYQIEEFREKKLGYCGICKVAHIKGRYHCEDCQVCIDGYDHHCPWTSKCIGKNNLCAFYAFLTNTVIFFTYNLINVTVLSRAMQHVKHKD